MPFYLVLKTLFYIDLNTISYVLLACLLGKCWEKHWAPVRRKWLRDSNLSLARASTSHPLTSLLKRSWYLIKLMVLLSITSTGLACILANWLCSLTSTPIPLLGIRMAIQMVMAIEVSFVLASLIINKLQRLVNMLRRQPIWRDTPDLELQMLERELTHTLSAYLPLLKLRPIRWPLADVD